MKHYQRFIQLLVCILLLFAEHKFAMAQENKDLTTMNKKALNAFLDAREKFDARKDDDAISSLQKAIKLDPAFIEAHLFLAEIYGEHNRYEEAIKEGETAIAINPGFFKSIYYSLGFWCFRIMKYDDAAKYLTTFLSYKGQPEEAVLNARYTLNSALFAKEAIKKPVPFNPVNLGPSVNSTNFDYLPTLTVDGQTLVYTQMIQSAKGDKSEDFFISQLKNGVWQKARNFGPPVNTEGNEGAECISADGNTLIFTACEERYGYTGGRKGFGSCDLFISRKMPNGQWTEPKNMGKPVNSEAWESQPALSSDGKILYFVSNRKGGKGSSDIYKSVFNDNGTWSVPVNLGDSINTPFSDESPFVHPGNSMLYFSSSGWPGMGKKDIFYVPISANDQYKKPVNLGYPINTSEDDWGLIVDASGVKAIYSSDRPGGIGGLDLYSFELPAQARPVPVTFLKGIITSSDNNKPLSSAIELIDLSTGKVVMNVHAAENGEYTVCLPANKDYALNVSAEGFLFHSENFSLKKSESLKPYNLNVKLDPVKSGSKVVLKNIFFETGSFTLKPESEVELGKLVKFLNSNAGLKVEISGHTDNIGDKKSNLILSENRAKSVYSYLTGKGIPADKLSYKGYGDSQPISSNDNEEGRAQNRRTEFVIK